MVRAVPAAEPATSPIVVEVGGVRVAVQRGFDSDALRAVLAVRVEACDVTDDRYVDRGPCDFVTGLDGGHRDEKTDYQSVIVRDHELCRAVEEVTGLQRVIRWIFDVEKIVEKFGRA